MSKRHSPFRLAAPVGFRPITFVLAAAALAALAATSPVAARGSESPAGARRASPEHHGHSAKARLERFARKQVGTASVYAHRLAGRKMADGARLDPNDHVAASKTLPLGSEAKVTNLETGRSTTVTIEDRGPYAKGRILDLSPAAAAQIGISRKQGVAKVEVAPIGVPPAKGSPVE